MASRTPRRRPPIGSLIAFAVALAACKDELDLFRDPPVSTDAGSADAPNVGGEEIVRRWKTLNDCADLFAQGSFRTTADGKTRRWCRGSLALDNCDMKSAADYPRDQHSIELSAWDNGFGAGGGLSLYVSWVPKTTGWGVRLDYYEGRNSHESEKLKLYFLRYDATTGPPATGVELGLDHSNMIVFVEGEFPSAGAPGPGRSKLPARAEAARFFGSPTMFREAGLDLLSRARKEVVATITDHKPRLHHGGNPVPPEGTLRPSTAAEEALELSKANKHFDEQESLLRAESGEMYKALLQAFPVRVCPP